MDIVETSMPNSNSQSPVSNPPGKPPTTGVRQRVISSCLTCRRRKVKCDHGHPICGACTRGNHVCTYASDPGSGLASPARITKPGFSANAKGGRSTDLQARLDRLEWLLEQVASGNLASEEACQRAMEQKKKDSPSSHGQRSDDHDGTLLLEEGQSQFVSSLHYALLADEIQDIRGLLTDKTSEEDRNVPTRNNLVHLLSLGRGKLGVTLEQLLPQSQSQRDTFLELYFTNVDPMIKITHRPTLLRKFSYHIQEAHPIAFAVFYSAIYSLPPAVCREKFGESKEDLLARFELGVEISLARENYLTTSSLDVLQGFILWLSCITSEDDMGKAWALLGVAIRIALSQGLHRDPSLFPSGSMDAVTIEIRRRIWHQICHLEYRAAEFKGQEPSISDEDFTTLLPRNIEDDNLVEGASPGNSPYDEERFTSMTFQLVRFVGMRSLRRIVQSTYRLERRMLESGLRGTSSPDPVQELQNIYQQIRTMVRQMHEENERKLLRFSDTKVPLHRLTQGLASLLEWRCYLLFWLRMPRAYRDIVFSNDLRKSIFAKSVKCVETLNGATVDVEVAQFSWHIGGHSAFQAIMHILSELRNPQFDAPDRQRAFRALQMSRLLRENNKTKAWAVVGSMIDKLLASEDARMRNSSDVYTNHPAPAVNNTASEGHMPIYVGQMPTYTYQHNTNSYTAPVSQPMPQPSQQLPPPQPPMPEFRWDDINLNNIIGDIPQPNPELPEFDWGFWGDPVNFHDQNVALVQMDPGPYLPFAT